MTLGPEVQVKRVLDAECERLQELVRTIRVKQGMVTE